MLDVWINGVQATWGRIIADVPNKNHPPITTSGRFTRTSLSYWQSSTYQRCTRQWWGHPSSKCCRCPISMAWYLTDLDVDPLWNLEFWKRQILGVPSINKCGWKYEVSEFPDMCHVLEENKLRWFPNNMGINSSTQPNSRVYISDIRLPNWRWGPNHSPNNATFDPGGTIAGANGLAVRLALSLGIPRAAAQRAPEKIGRRFLKLPTGCCGIFQILGNLEADFLGGNLWVPSSNLRVSEGALSG